MELLGNENKYDDILENVIHINRSLLTISSISDEDCQKLLRILVFLADTKNKEILYEKEVMALILQLLGHYITRTSPIINNLAEEIKLCLIRMQCLELTASDESTAENNLRSIKRERFLPTPDNKFLLPEKGQIINLTVREPDTEIGKTLVRELMIDHDGYVVEETSKRYEDIYTDESESIYNDIHLKELQTAKAAQKLKNQGKVTSANIEKEKICNGCE